MQVLIIEDETPAANRLSSLLRKIGDDMTVAGHLDSVESSVKFLGSSNEIDLAFMDIQLADGISFDIFNQVAVSCPVIFTTAYEQYTLKAFKVNSIDYLLKPIDEKELRAAVEKYRKIYQDKKTDLPSRILKMVQEMNGNHYRERILIKRGQQYSFLKISEMAYGYADGKLCYAVDLNGNRFLLESNLSLLEAELSPRQFFRINRHLIVGIDSIKKVHTWLGGRLKLEIHPVTTAETVVSRERVNAFKEWLGE